MEVFNLQQENKNQQEKLAELIEQDEEEKEVIQELNQTKRELIKAQRELMEFSSTKKKEFDLNKVYERRHKTIPF
jgi:hypothetical protein